MIYRWRVIYWKGVYDLEEAHEDYFTTRAAAREHAKHFREDGWRAKIADMGPNYDWHS